MILAEAPNQVPHWPVKGGRREPTNKDRERVAALIRTAFAGVTLGDGVGLRQGQGLDAYAGDEELAELRATDENGDWTKIPVADLDYCYSSLSFFDAEGMRFHLPAYLIADLSDSPTLAMH